MVERSVQKGRWFSGEGFSNGPKHENVDEVSQDENVSGVRASILSVVKEEIEKGFPKLVDKLGEIDEKVVEKLGEIDLKVTELRKCVTAQAQDRAYQAMHDETPFPGVIYSTMGSREKRDSQALSLVIRGRSVVHDPTPPIIVDLSEKEVEEKV